MSSKVAIANAEAAWTSAASGMSSKVAIANAEAAWTSARGKASKDAGVLTEGHRKRSSFFSVPRAGMERVPPAPFLRLPPVHTTRPIIAMAQQEYDFFE